MRADSGRRASDPAASRPQESQARILRPGRRPRSRELSWPSRIEEPRGFVTCRYHPHPTSPAGREAVEAYIYAGGYIGRAKPWGRTISRHSARSKCLPPLRLCLCVRHRRDQHPQRTSGYSQPRIALPFRRSHRHCSRVLRYWPCLCWS